MKKLITDNIHKNKQDKCWFYRNKIKEMKGRDTKGGIWKRVPEMIKIITTIDWSATKLYTNIKFL